MKFSENYPDFATIEKHIHRARIERAVAVSEMIVDAIQATRRGFRALKESLERNFQTVERRSAKPDFLKRVAPR